MAGEVLKLDDYKVEKARAELKKTQKQIEDLLKNSTFDQEGNWEYVWRSNPATGLELQIYDKQQRNLTEDKTLRFTIIDYLNNYLHGDKNYTYFADPALQTERATKLIFVEKLDD